MNSIRFYNVDFFSEYADVIDFPSPTRREQYFSSKYINIETENIQIVKPPYNYVKVTGDYNEFQQVNYCIFTLEVTTNGETSTRDYYCFVDRVDYAGVGVVGLALSLDVWQTTLFNADGSAGFELEECHVERGHMNVLTSSTAADVKYLQTPEQVDAGTEIYTGSLFDPTDRVNLGSEWGERRVGYAYVQSTEPIAAVWGDPIWGMFPNLQEPIAYTGLSTLYLYVVPVVLNQVAAQEATTKLYGKASVAGIDAEVAFPTLLELYTQLKGNPAVVDISVTNIAPVTVTYAAGTKANSLVATPNNSGTRYVQGALFTSAASESLAQMACWIPVTMPGLDAANEYSFSVSNGTIVDPDLVKTLVYPFKFYKITNNKVGDYIIKPQYLSSVQESQKLTLCARTAPSGTGSLVTSYYIDGYLNGGARSPFHYSDELNAPEDNLSGSLPLMTDAYKSYMASSKASMQAGLASKAISGLAGFANGVGTGVMGVAGIAGGIARTAAQIQDLKDTPQTMRGNGQNLNISALSELLGVIVWQCSASSDMRERAHEYFRRFGYTVNENIKYNTKSRRYWNYVKTTDAVVSTKFGTYYSQELRRIFNAGVRIWHYPDSASGVGWNGVGVYKDEDGDNYVNLQVGYE